MKNILSPSILAADFAKLGQDIETVKKAGAEWLHIDVMDGSFVPAISFGRPVMESIRRVSDMFFDTHLMIERPERYIDYFAEAGADLINFHIESTQDIRGTIEKIRSAGKKAGITIKPGTPVKEVVPFIELVDMVLVMTVEPGFGEQKIIPECIEKVRELRSIAEKMGIALNIEVDGGIKLTNVADIIKAGANVIVSGSAVFKGNIEENAKAFLKILN